MGLRDGEDMSLLHTHRLQNSTVAPKDLWVTDMVLLHNVHKVTLTFRKSSFHRSVSWSWCHTWGLVANVIIEMNVEINY